MTGEASEQYECYDCRHYKPDTLGGGGGIGGFGSCPFRAAVRAWSPICDRFQDGGEWKELTEAYARPDECPWMGSGICWWSRGYCSSQAYCEADLGEWGAWRSVLWIIGDASMIQKAAEICPWTDVQKIKALDIAGTIARVALGAVGWSL